MVFRELALEIGRQPDPSQRACLRQESLRVEHDDGDGASKTMRLGAPNGDVCCCGWKQVLMMCKRARCVVDMGARQATKSTSGARNSKSRG